MRKGLFFGVVLLLSTILLASLVIAPGNDTDNNSSNNSNQNNNSVQCNEDSDCSDNYECEDGSCVVDDEDEEENESNDDNESSSDDEDDDSEDEAKVCCYRYKEREGKIEGKYEFKERNDCIKNESRERREVVNDSFCKGSNEFKIEIKERNRIKFEGRTGQQCPEECTCTGVVMKCQLASGREMIIYAGNSGNVIVQVKGINMSTNVTLYKENETLYGNFSNRTREIKILPDEARERIREKIKSHIENESEIELDDNGFYKIEGKKKAKLFWVFSVREQIRAEVDIEDGETKTHGSWWGFLANDNEDDS